MTVRPRTSLIDHPDLAQKIGLVVAEYAVLEMLMYTVFAMYASKPETAFQRFFSLRSIVLRKQLMVHEARNQLDKNCMRALKKLWRRFESAATRRTEIAHCSYLADTQTVVKLRLVGDKAIFEPIMNDFFDRTFTQYQILGSDLLIFAALLGQNTDHVHRVMRQLPPWQGRSTPPPHETSQHPATEHELAEQAASLARLGLQP